MRYFFVTLFSIAVLFLATGCQASLYDLPGEEAAPSAASFEMALYENKDVGLKFEFPDYYGEPNLQFYDGKTGEAFILSFTFNTAQVANPNDPFIVYFTGGTSDFENFNKFEKMNYVGKTPVDKVCDDPAKALNKLQFVGSNCEVFRLETANDFAARFNASIVDVASNSVEQIVLAKYPAGYKYAGLQLGIKVPVEFIEFSRFDSVQKRGEKAVLRLIERLDTGNLPESLVDEVDRFRVVSESLQFIK